MTGTPDTLSGAPDIRAGTAADGFAGSPGASTPSIARARAGLCWGQHWSWHQQRLPPGRRAPTLLLRRIFRVPDGVGSQPVRRAVAGSIVRHWSLRSTYSAPGGGEPRQQVWPADGARWAFREFTDPAECESWLSGDIEIESGWPIRAASMRPGGNQTWVGVAAHHIATDLYGLNLLCAELQTAVRAHAAGVEPTLPAVDRQAVDIARYECSPEGIATSARAIGYWRRHADEMAEAISVIAGRAERQADALHVARTTIDVGGRHLDAIGRRRGRAAVLVGAIATALARHLGRDRVPMLLLTPNRHLPGVKNSVCSLAQAGLCMVDAPAGEPLGVVAANASYGLLQAQRFGYCDHDELTRIMTPAQVGRHGFAVTPPSVNVMREDEAGAQAVQPALPDSFPTVAVRTVDRPCLGLNFHLSVAESRLSVELRAGEHLGSAEDCQALVSAVVRAILDA